MPFLITDLELAEGPTRYLKPCGRRTSRAGHIKGGFDSGGTERVAHVMLWPFSDVRLPVPDNIAAAQSLWGPGLTVKIRRVGRENEERDLGEGGGTKLDATKNLQSTNVSHK